MAVAAALMILLLATPAVVFAATQHVVGGSAGWTNFGPDYSTWSAGQTFTVGDTLLFNYGGSHQVAVVSQSDYSSCNAANAINTYNDGSTTISLTQAGPMYFICPAAGHCGSGMKLAVNVVAATSGSPATPATPSGSTPAGTPPTTTGTASSSPTPPAAAKSGAVSTGSGLMVGSLAVLGTMLLC